MTTPGNAAEETDANNLSQFSHTDHQAQAVDDPWAPTPSDAQVANSPATRVAGAASSPGADVASVPTTLPTTLEVLRNPMPTDRLIGWAVTVTIAAIAFLMRLPRLAYPNTLMFDETYYPKDAWSLLNYGYEQNYADGANDKISCGNLTGLWHNSPEFMVHPPLGKWLIASGEWMFGMNSFGWRFPSLVFGTLMIAAVVRLGRRLSRSTLIGGLAGFLLAFDGLQFVMSRVGLLDIFQATFLVLAVGTVAADRDWFRDKLSAYLVKKDIPDLGGKFGPFLWWRPWRAAAGVLFGLAIAVKWNSIFVLAVMGTLSVIWDISSRITAGARWSSMWGILKDGIPALFWMVVLAIPVYVASWAGWLSTTGGYDRDWGAKNPDSQLVHLLGAPLASLVKYHQDMYAFHTGNFIMNEATHPYDAHPVGWLFNVRPILIDVVRAPQVGQKSCAPAVAEGQIGVIYGLGTPFLWWFAAIALVAGIYYWIAHRDYRFGLPILAVASTYLPWFRYADRPVFFFYAICIVPFTVIILALCLGKILGPANGPNRRRGALIVGGAVLSVVLCFGFFYPIFSDGTLSMAAYQWRMWFGSWR